MASFSVPVLRTFYQGQVASGALVYVYQSTTTTPVTTYSDAGLTTPNTNPIVADSNGEVLFYVDNSLELRIDLKTSGGTLIRSIDPVFPVPDLTGFTGSGTDLNYLTGVTQGTVSASKAVIVDGSKR